MTTDAEDVSKLRHATLCVRAALRTFCQTLMRMGMRTHAAKAWLFSRSSAFHWQSMSDPRLDADIVILVWKEIETLTGDVRAALHDSLSSPDAVSRVLDQARSVDVAIETLLTLWCCKLEGLKFL